MKKPFLYFILMFLAALGLNFVACSESKTENNATQNATNSQQKPIIRAFATVPALTTLLYLIQPEGIIGINYKPYPEDLEFMPKNTPNLPILGVRNELNYEAIVALKPDVIIFPDFVDKQMMQKYEMLNIKTLMVSIEFRDLEQVIKKYGEILNEVKRAQKLNDFYKKMNEKMDKLRAKVAKKPRIYFAFGLDGLLTGCASDEQKDDLATMMGAVNVIKCPLKQATQQNIAMDFERVLAAEPEVIFVREIGFYKELMNAPNKQWQRLEAVKNKRIIYAPSSPSNWLTHPHTAMRIIGYPWAFAKLHPELLSENEAKKIAQEFFAEFLRPLSDEAYRRLEAKD